MADPANPFDHAVDKLYTRQSKQRAAATLLNPVEPEAMGEGIQLGKELNVPAQAVVSAPELFRSQAAQQRASTALATAPKLSEWLGDPTNAALAKDDLDNLTWFERNFRGFIDTSKSVGRSTGGGALGMVESTLRGIATIEPPLPEELAPNELRFERGRLVLPEDETEAETARRDLLTEIFRPKMENRAPHRAAESLEQFIADNLAPDEDLAGHFWLDKLPQGAGSFLTFLLSGPAMLFTGAAANAGQQYEEAIEEGASEEDALRAADLGALVGSTEAVPVFRALQPFEKFVPGLRSYAARALGRIARSAGEEAAQEAFATIMNNLIAQNVYDPGRETFEGAGESAAIGGILGGFLGGATAGIRGRDDRETQTEAAIRRFYGAGKTSEALEEIDAQAEASQVRARSTDHFLDALNQAGAPDLYVSAEGLQEYYQAKDMALDDEMMAMIGLDRDDFDAKLATGGDVAIPTSHYAAHISGTDDAAWFHANAVLDPEEMSVAEAQEFNDRVREIMEEEFQKAEAQREADEAAQASDVQVYDEMFRQLRSAGQSPDVAQQNATVWSAFWRSMSDRYGEDALELARTMGVEVRGPQSEITRRRASVDMQLNVLRAKGDRALRPSGPSLIEFIRSRGGVQDVGGDLGALDLPRGVIAETDAEIRDRRSQPTMGGLPTVGKGESLEDAARAAVEAGYFPELLGKDADPLQPFKDAIQAEASGAARYVEGEGPNEALTALSERLSELGIDLADVSNDDAVAALEADADGVMFDQAPVGHAFEAWAGTPEVIDPEDVNNTDFSGEGPFVMRVFHGTTHDFEAFNASIRGTKEGQFGAVNYFTTSEADASDNYGADGPDLTRRIEGLAERFYDELLADIEDSSAQEVLDREFPNSNRVRDLADGLDGDDLAIFLSQEKARLRLEGQNERVLEVFVRTEKPFVVGGGTSPWIDFIDFEAVQEQAVMRVAEEHNLNPENVDEWRDDFEDEIYDAQWEIEAETENPLVQAINDVSARYDADPADLFDRVMEVQNEGTTTSNLEKIMRESESIAYAEDPEDGGLVGYHMLGEIIQELGFDSIILKDAGDRFETMDIEPGTSHVHVFDASRTNIKSVENTGTFDPEDPRILFQDGLGVAYQGVFLAPEMIEKLTQAAAQWERNMGADGGDLDQDAAGGILADQAMVEKVISILEKDDEGLSLIEQGEAEDPDGYLFDLINWASSLSDPTLKFFQENRGSIQLPRGGLTEGQTVINLFESADLSTFLHESGHFFLEAFTELSRSDNAPQAMRDDMMAIRKFLELEPGEAYGVEHHEKWARGFEAYLMEGKAPSLELASAFARFKAWLARIYRSIAGLDVKLNPEIREVMDRLLATDDEIAAAREAQDMRPLFTEAPDGMSDRDWQVYQRTAQRAVEQAEQKLLERSMEKLRRETQKWYREERKAMRKEVEAELHAQPVYRLTELLGNQRWLGEGDGDVPDLRLDRAALVEQFGEGVLPELSRTRLGGKRAIYAKDGERPETIAMMFGFSSVSDMIAALQNAGKLKDQIEIETDRRLLDRYGDPLNDGSIEEAAVLAVHSEQEAQARVIEARTMAKAAGRSTRNMKSKVYRARAQAMLGRMSVREASRPQAFLAAERRAARRAEEAFAAVVRGGRDAEAKLAEALQAKEQQILNGHLYREAREFADRLQKQREKMRAYGKKSVREKLAGGYIEQIDGLLDAYDFRVRSGRQVERAESLRDFVERMTAEGREAELAIDDRLLDEARRTHYTRLSVDELNGLFDTIANIDHMGRFKQKLIDRKAARDLAETVSGIVGSINDNVKGKKPSRVETAGERRRKVARDYLNLTLNADTLLREMDGFKDLGAVWSAIKAPIDQGMATLTERRLQMAKDFDAIYGAYSVQEQRDMAVKRRVEALDGEFSKWDVMAIALNTGNQDNYQRLTNPKTDGSFTPDQVNAALAELDARDWQTVQAIWDHINSFWPEIEAKEKRLTGVAPKKVEAQMMFEGAPASVSGGYYPIKYDTRLSGRMADYEQRDLADALMGGRFGKAQTRNGHTKERVASVAQPLLLDLSVAHNHVSQVLYDLEVGEAVGNAWKLLQHSEVKSALVDKGKKADHEALEIWVQDVATGDQVAARGIERYMRHLRTGFVISRLAVNISTAAIQPTGLSQSGVLIGKRAVAKGTIDYFSHMGRWVREVQEVSPLMRERQKTFERDIFNVVGDLEGGPVSGRWAKFQRDVVLPFSFLLMQKVQFYAVDMPTWVSAYQKEIAASSDEAKARLYADTMVRRAQGSGLLSDRGMLERGTLSKDSRQREFPRMLTALGSYMFAKGNVAYERTMRTEFRDPIEVMSWAVDMGLLFTFEAVLYSAVKGFLPDEEEDKGKWLLQETAFSMMSTQPGLREISGAMQGFGSGGIFGSVIEKAFAKPVEQLGQGEIDQALVRSMIDMAGIWLHLPSSQTNAVIKGLFDDDMGVRRNINPLEVVGVGTGETSLMDWFMENR